MIYYHIKCQSEQKTVNKTKLILLFNNFNSLKIPLFEKGAKVQRSDFHVTYVCLIPSAACFIEQRSLTKIILTCTPRIPKIMKNVAAMSTMLPIGLRDEMRVSTTNLRPGARLMTLVEKQYGNKKILGVKLAQYIFCVS